MAEQLALQQAGRDGGAVELDERALARGLRSWMARAISSLPVPVSPWISTVESVGATVSTCFSTCLQRRALADDLLEVVLGADLLFQVELLLLSLSLSSAISPEGQRVLDGDGDLLGHLAQQFHIVVVNASRSFAAEIQRPERAVAGKIGTLHTA